ncbi:hypothetical protein G4B88_025355, partial [Cannabis sativa]
MVGYKEDFFLTAVDELKTSGSFFTWSNNNDEKSRVYSKLDRVFTNEGWLDCYPNTEASFRWGAISDHSYCLVKLLKVSKCGIKPFCFCNFWMLKEGYKELVLSAWKSHLVSDLKSLHQQLFRIKHLLKNCYVNNNESITGMYKEAREKLMEAQDFLASNPKNSTAASKERAAFAQFQSTREQNSKACWLKLGDENTSYFHSIMKKRRAENKICSYTVDGVVVDEYDK